MSGVTRKRLGELLIEDGLISKENLEEALEHQRNQGGLIGQIFIRLGYLTEEQLVAALGRQLRIPYIPLASYAVNMESVNLVDQAFSKKNVLVIFDRDEHRAFVAVSDPLNSSVIEEIRQRTKLKPQVFISTSTEITNILDLAYSREAQQPHKKAG